MSTKKTIKWWKVVLPGAVGLLFLCLLIAVLPMTADAYSSFAPIARRAGFFEVVLYSERASLYPVYLCMELFNASGAALAIYGLVRCFRPAKIKAENAEVSRKRWRAATYIGLSAFVVCILALFLYGRTHSAYHDGIANGGEWKTAADLLIAGWLGTGAILFADLAIFSLIRRKEWKQLTKQGE